MDFNPKLKAHLIDMNIQARKWPFKAPLGYRNGDGKPGKPLTGSWSKGRSKRYANYRCQNKPCKAVSITKADLERGFVEFLERMQPKPQYTKLFTAIVLDVWKEKQAQNITLNASLKQHLEDWKAAKIG